MGNEPVAWIRQSKYGKPIIVQNPCYQISYEAECAKWDDIPLYTHPAKTLTDEEYKPLTEEDAPYQKVASKEITDAIDKALGLKTLTDEEIETIFQKETGFTLDCDAKVDEVAMLDFARAILKKAQEK